jgi:hypothetical protein
MLPKPVLGQIQPPIQWVPGALSPGVKRLGGEAVCSPPTNAEVTVIGLHFNYEIKIEIGNCRLFSVIHIFVTYLILLQTV